MTINKTAPTAIKAKNNQDSTNASVDKSTTSKVVEEEKDTWLVKNSVENFVENFVENLVFSVVIEETVTVFSGGRVVVGLSKDE